MFFLHTETLFKPKVSKLSISSMQPLTCIIKSREKSSTNDILKFDETKKKFMLQEGYCLHLLISFHSCGDCRNAMIKREKHMELLPSILK